MTPALAVLAARLPPPARASLNQFVRRHGVDLVVLALAYDQRQPARRVRIALVRVLLQSVPPAALAELLGVDRHGLARTRDARGPAEITRRFSSESGIGRGLTRDQGPSAGDERCRVSAHRIERGEGWEMHLGDCLEVLPTLEQVDCVITDPPYEEEAHTKARRSLKDATQKRGASNAGEVRRIDAPLEIAFAQMSDHLRGTSAGLIGSLVRRWVIAFCQIEAIAAWRGALTGAGLDWVRGGVWIKPNGSPQFTGDRPGQGFESLAIAHKPGRKRWNGGGKHAVWTCPLDHHAGGGGQAEHPTIKPLRLMLDLVSDFTDPHESILDPFAGSGTTGVAALRLGRRFVGIEKEERFFSLAVERLRAEERGISLHAARSGQLSILEAINAKG